MNAPRRVDPEWLDSLPPDDPRAQRSRRDLRRVNRVMLTQRLIGPPVDRLVRAAVAASRDAAAPVPVVELGAGDGRMFLPLGSRYARHWPALDLTLIDRQPVVEAKALDDYRALGWKARVERADVLRWLARPAPDARPIIVANLFVHHFAGERLRALLDGVASHASAFLCLEPRRARFALASSRMLGAIGCNDVTRHDAVVSVRAGFTGSELSALWSRPDAWSLEERPAGLFSHLFCATRRPAHADRA